MVIKMDRVLCRLSDNVIGFIMGGDADSEPQIGIYFTAVITQCTGIHRDAVTQRTVVQDDNVSGEMLPTDININPISRTSIPAYAAMNPLLRIQLIVVQYIIFCHCIHAYRGIGMGVQHHIMVRYCDRFVACFIVTGHRNQDVVVTVQKYARRYCDFIL